mmetsp:Transcript_24127/g.75017  ORF Transcript_24127/g.75017 Transcript_24127/m.75017 type:complete len:246 (-) Transcript_24127:1331-2068(-)
MPAWARSVNCWFVQGTKHFAPESPNGVSKQPAAVTRLRHSSRAGDVSSKWITSGVRALRVSFSSTAPSALSGITSLLLIWMAFSRSSLSSCFVSGRSSVSAPVRASSAKRCGGGPRGGSRDASSLAAAGAEAAAAQGTLGALTTDTPLLLGPTKSTGIHLQPGGRKYERTFARKAPPARLRKEWRTPTRARSVRAWRCLRSSWLRSTYLRMGTSPISISFLSSRKAKAWMLTSSAKESSKAGMSC